MDLPPQRPLRRTPRSARPGLALPVAIMAIVFLAAIPLGLFGIATLEARARANEAAAARAQELAESGLAHALAILNGPLAQVTTANLLLGPNGVWNGGTGDDGLLIDSVATGETGLSAGWWQVAPSTGIPSIGSARLAGGKYYVRVIEDPAEVARIAGALRARARRGAVVLSLHDPGLARAIATHAAILRGGRITESGAAEVILTTANLSAAYAHPISE